MDSPALRKNGRPVPAAVRLFCHVMCRETAWYPSATHGGACSVEWDEPYGGECTDVFVLGDGGYSLTQLSDMLIRGSGRRCKYRHAHGLGWNG